MSIINESGLSVESLQAQLKGKLLSVTSGRRGRLTVSIACERCGKEFHDYISQMKTRRFCGPECRKQSFEIRFWNKVDKSPNESGCWIWTASLNRDGYGHFPCSELKELRAHRISWVLQNGPIPEGMSVLHKQNCKSRACVNYDHLYLGNQTDNMQDAVAVGTHYKAYGENGANSLLTNESANRIRNLYATKNYTQEDLASMFSVSRRTIYAVVKNKTYVK